MKPVLRLLRVALLWVFDHASESVLAWQRKTVGASAPRRVEFGFIFTSDVGDAVLFSMFLLVFSKKVNGRCLVITSEMNARLLQPFFPEADFLTLDYARYKAEFTYRFQKLKEVMRFSVNRCIVPMRSRDYCITDSIAKAAKKDWLLAFASDESNRDWLEARLENSFYDELLGGFSVGTHELQTYALLLDKFGIDFCKELKAEVTLFRARARELVVPLPIAIGSGYVLMNVGASQLYKRWPIERFISLAERIHVEFGLVSVFVGGPSEQDLKGAFGAYPFIVDLVMKTGNFDVLRGVIVNATAVVSNDTFISHYSTVLGMPVVCIAGGGHAGRFLPYPEKDYAIFFNSCTISRQWPCFNCGWACTRLSDMTSGSFPCIGGIGIDEVFAATEMAIEQRGRLEERKPING